MPGRNLFLICNAHLDPVWLWMWQEGLAETLTTFRTAARFCEEFEEFVFCHNEAVLYQWVEQYEPALFRRIRDLVGQGRWHILGGWYLQPDCNLPCGESFVRQDSVTLGVPGRQKGNKRGPSERDRGEAVPENKALIGQFAQVRGQGGVSPPGPEAVGPQGIDADHDHMGARFCPAGCQKANQQDQKDTDFHGWHR